MSEDDEKIKVEFRGPSTPRHLSSEFDEGTSAGVPILDMLGLSLDDVRGKRVLDVGTGQGVALKEALEEGYDWIGCDIAPAVNNARSDVLLESSANATRRLASLAKKYPGRIIAADAAEAIPLADDSVDMAISCVGLPNYARDEREAAISILEMTRVAREKVVFTLGSNITDILDKNDGVAYFGARNTFGFPLSRFLNEVYGEGNWSFNHGKRKGEWFISVEINCVNKDLDRIRNNYNDISAGDEKAMSRLKAY